MVGGKIDIIWNTPDQQIINVLDRIAPSIYDQCFIHVVQNDLPMQRGDGIWWQARKAFWTPAGKVVQDVPIERIGYSYTLKDQAWPDEVAQMLKDGMCPECNLEDCMADGYGSLWCPRCGASYTAGRLEMA